MYLKLKYRHNLARHLHFEIDVLRLLIQGSRSCYITDSNDLGTTSSRSTLSCFVSGSNTSQSSTQSSTSSSNLTEFIRQIGNHLNFNTNDDVLIRGIAKAGLIMRSEHTFRCWTILKLVEAWCMWCLLNHISQILRTRL